MQNLPNKTRVPLPKLSKVAYRQLRTGQRVHQGNQWDAARVPARKNEARIPGQDSSEGAQKEDRKEGTRSKSLLTQQSQKITAQQILKNNQMVAKYDKLDAQLQNVTF